MAMIAMFPLLVTVEPNIAICFYAMMLTASQFSGSVSAIWFGLLGEIASAPILKERTYIVQNSLQLSALRNTALASALATFLSCIGLYVFFQFALFNPWILRTEVVLVTTLLVFVFCLFWPQNTRYHNLLLIVGGLFVGKIGFDQLTQTDFLTFNNPYLYAGIPAVPVILGLYAVPALIQLLRMDIRPNLSSIGVNRASFPIAASVRGSILGFIIGLVPMVGTTICSTSAYYVEKKLKTSPIHCISSAESANNAAVISVLIPLLLLGLPIQPSEIVLYTIITENNWSTVSVTIGSILQLLGLILLATGISYLICWSFVVPIAEWVHRYFKIGIYVIVLAIASNVAYIGFLADQSTYYLICFFVSLFVGLWLIKHVDPIPGLMMFMLQNHMFDSFNRSLVIYS